MFSTSIRPSSISTPRPRTSPPRVMVLSPSPNSLSAATASTRARGTLRNETSAALGSLSEISISARASTPPMARSVNTLRTAEAITKSGRSRSEVTTTPWASSDGLSSSSAR